MNENPECGNTSYADFTRKPYFNIMIDDKAFFQPRTDWVLTEIALEEIYKIELKRETKNVVHAVTNEYEDDLSNFWYSTYKGWAR